MDKPNKIILMFVAILLGVAFLGALNSMIDSKVNLITGSETEGEVNFTEGEHILGIISTYPTASCSGIEIINATGGEEVIGEGNYTFYSTNCTYVAQTNSAYINEDVNQSYNYEVEPDEYIDNSTTRLLINLLIGLFALVILIGLVVGLFKLFERD